MPLPHRIFVSGHTGMVGGAVVRRLSREPGVTVLTATRAEVDLTNAAEVESFFASERPSGVIFCAGKVGGIVANNTYPVEFLVDNARMAINAITSAYANDVSRFLYLGSTCIYPKLAPQPIQEKSLLTSELEPTNEAYALAKITGLKLCEYYRRQYGVMYHSAMPTNLYGPGDNYHPAHSHVLPALIRRFHEANQNALEEVQIWGTGSPRREFLHVDDLADGLVHLIGLADPPNWVNLGTGVDHTILEIAHMVAETVGFRGKIVTDPTKPDGTPRKITDTTLLNSTGWKAQINLREGLKDTYAAFLQEQSSGLLRAV